MADFVHGYRNIYRREVSRIQLANRNLWRTLSRTTREDLIRNDEDSWIAAQDLAFTQLILTISLWLHRFQANVQERSGCGSGLLVASSLTAAAGSR